MCFTHVIMPHIYTPQIYTKLHTNYTRWKFYKLLQPHHTCHHRSHQSLLTIKVKGKRRHLYGEVGVTWGSENIYDFGRFHPVRGRNLAFCVFGTLFLSLEHHVFFIERTYFSKKGALLCGGNGSSIRF